MTVKVFHESHIATGGLSARRSEQEVEPLRENLRFHFNGYFRLCWTEVEAGEGDILDDGTVIIDGVPVHLPGPGRYEIAKAGQGYRAL